MIAAPDVDRARSRTDVYAAAVALIVFLRRRYSDREPEIA